MSDKPKPPMETIEPAVGPNPEGLSDQARGAQWRKHDAGDEPAPDSAAKPRRRPAAKRARKSGGES